MVQGRESEDCCLLYRMCSIDESSLSCGNPIQPFLLHPGHRPLPVCTTIGHPPSTYLCHICLRNQVSAMLGFGSEVKHCYRYQYDEDDDVNFDYEVQQSDGDEKEAAKGCWSDRGRRTEQEKVY